MSGIVPFRCGCLCLVVGLAWLEVPPACSPRTVTGHSELRCPCAVVSPYLFGAGPFGGARSSGWFDGRHRAVSYRLPSAGRQRSRIVYERSLPVNERSGMPRIIDQPCLWESFGRTVLAAGLTQNEAAERRNVVSVDQSGATMIRHVAVHRQHLADACWRRHRGAVRSADVDRHGRHHGPAGRVDNAAGGYSQSCLRDQCRSRGVRLQVRPGRCLTSRSWTTRTASRSYSRLWAAKRSRPA